MKATLITLCLLALTGIYFAISNKPTENKTGITDDANEDDNMIGL